MQNLTQPQADMLRAVEKTTTHRNQITDPEIQAIVRNDLREGANAGVRGIPTIFINGKLLRNRSFAGFKEAIEKELAKAPKR